jgi:hypothetical protein
MLLWAAVYFFLQMKEIHDGIDEGLTNFHKLLLSCLLYFCRIYL